MRLVHWLAATTAVVLLTPAAHAQVAPGDAQQTPETAAQVTPEEQEAQAEIVVTARRREERLQDVPIAVTALTGDFLRDKQVNTVKDIAAYTPGLNINSDGVGRAFVSIRGVGTTLIDTVQPGVGIFIDGIYQPNTSYLNSPIVDVARIEVLRGPQGTLFGNNTLGGAINVITRVPSNEFTGRVDAAYAGPDDYQSLSGTISGPIVRDRLQFRIGASYHKQDGFQDNLLAGGKINPLKQQSVNGTLRVLPADWATFTANASYDRVFGGNTAYIGVSGPTDYRLDGRTNQRSLATIDYYGANLKGEFDVDALNTKVTAIGAYNRRDVRSISDADFNPLDFFRSQGESRLKTKTGELRFDTQWSDSISTLVGVFADKSTLRTSAITTVVIAGNARIPSSGTSSNTNKAIFGTVFVKLDPTLDLAVGLRYDRQKLDATTNVTAPTYKADEVQPRVTLTKRWQRDFMTYASVARGVRGGGQNGPGAPNLIYEGDSVWTYEAGTKFSALARRLTLNASVFYNDYDDFIGQNSLAPSTILNPATGQPVGFVAINLNTGTVRSYGAEFEGHLRLTDSWNVDAGLTLLNARVTDDGPYRAIVGNGVSSDRIIFTPDYNFNLNTDYTVPLGANALILSAGVIGKGSRIGSSLDPAVAPRLSPYTLVNGSIAFRLDNGFEIAAFGTNIFNEKYIESYIDRSALVRAGLAPLAQNLAIPGERRRYGVRASFKF